MRAAHSDLKGEVGVAWPGAPDLHRPHEAAGRRSGAVGDLLSGGAGRGDGLGRVRRRRGTELWAGGGAEDLILVGGPLWPAIHLAFAATDFAQLEGHNVEAVWHAPPLASA